MHINCVIVKSYHRTEDEYVNILKTGFSNCKCFVFYQLRIYNFATLYLVLDAF